MASTPARPPAAKGAGRTSKGRRRLIDYPRRGRTGFRRWLPSWRLVLGTFFTVIFLLVGFVVGVYRATTIPAPQEGIDNQMTTVYYSDGKSVMGTFAIERRELVELATLPKHVTDAVVASEDQTFFENAGVDFSGIARALWVGVTTGDRQGGSTITQQYVERVFRGTTTDYWGKFEEALLAIKIRQEKEPEEILESYLNTIYFGRGTYGVQAAAQGYFGVDAKDLTVSQTALLVGVIPSPSNFDPAASEEQALRRWGVVLDRMVSEGYLTQAERDSQEFPEVKEVKTSETYSGTKGYLLELVRHELRTRGSMTDEDIDTSGLKIVTTFDKEMQAQAVAAVKDMPEDKPKGLRPAVVTIDPTDGAVLALYGGPNYLKQQFNNAAQGTAQAGSTFKPFTLVAGLEKGISLRTRFSGASPLKNENFPDGTSNFGGRSWGSIDLVTATANSVNTAYARLNEEVGPDATRDVAIRAGIPESTTDLKDNYANVLGTASPTPLDMAEAYATFAAQGVHHEHFFVREATYLQGGTAYVGATTGKRVFAEDVMADTTYALTQVVETGSGKTVRGVGRPVAGKTGTSNSNKSAWFVGYTPQLATAVALYQVGEDGGQEDISSFGGYGQITGSTVPADVWTAYMKEAVERYDVVQFPPRANVGTQPVRSTSPTPSSTPSETPSEEPGTIRVPSGLEGKMLGDAVAMLEEAGLTASVVRQESTAVAEGRVISSSPGGGTEVEEGATVTLVVSTGPRDVPSTSPTPTPPPKPSPSPTSSPKPSPKPSQKPSQSPTPTPPPENPDGDEGADGGDGTGTTGTGAYAASATTAATVARSARGPLRGRRRR